MSHQLPLARAIFLLVAVLYPCGYFAFTRLIPGTNESLGGRLAVAALFAVGLAFTYLRPFRPYAYRYMTMSLCVMVIHYIWMLYSNDFHRAYIIGTFVIFTTANAAFTTRASSIIFIVCFLVAAFVAFSHAPKEVISRVILGGLIVIALVQLLLTELRVRMARKIQEFFAERERANERLAATSTLSSLGEMAAGIAHEINNPLAIMLLRMSALEEHLRKQPSPGNEESLKLVNGIMTTTQRIERIVRGMMSLSRDASGDPMGVVSVAECVDDVLSICSEKFGLRGVDLVVDVAPELTAYCRSTQVSQVLLNLLSNALDAVEGATTRRVWVSARRQGAGVELRVADSGPGVDPSVRDKLFLPFFTTKKPGRGTGLGLSISRRIVEDHGGTLTLEPEARTTFVVRLAASEGCATAPFSGSAP